jgi:hypothetical protein
MLNAHAAALGEAARFDAAVDFQKDAVLLLPSDDPAAPDYRARLTLYRSQTPYRLPPASNGIAH